MRMASWKLMMLAAMLLPPGIAVARADPAEDEAYRVDRMRTRELNASALKRLAEPAPTPSPAPERRAAPPPVPAPIILPPEDVQLRVREDNALAAWRARTAACRAGDRKSCDRR